MGRLFKKIQNLFPVSSTPVAFQRSSLGHKVVAHAMGEWGNQKYLNTKEAFETNYAKGVRLFEADFFRTSDNKIVLFHQGHEKRFGLAEKFTEEEFLKIKPYGSTTLNLQGFAALLKQYPEARIITDGKGNNVANLEDIIKILKEASIDYKNVIIPQIYNPKEFSPVKELGFKKIVFTVYRFKDMKNVTGRFIKKHPEISALTVPDEWIESKNYLELAKKCSIEIFVHSIESAERRDHLLKLGVHGIYTPNLF